MDLLPHSRQAIIVAHGWPSKPAIMEAEIAWLAARVEGVLANWRIRSATLASPGALRSAIKDSDASRPLHIYPFFMSDGWFVADNLRRRVIDKRDAALEWHAPFGLSPKLSGLCVELLKSSTTGMDLSQLTLVTLAHGSPDNTRPAEVARWLTDDLSNKLGFADSRCGFVEEPPFLEDVLNIAAPVICLPLFAGLAGHVRKDLVEALAKSNFKGKILPVIGTHPNVPDLIAKDLVSSDRS